MRQRILINKIEVNESEMILKTDQVINIMQYNAVGQILVDSDNFSFVYLLENSDGYTYVDLKEPTWKKLKPALVSNMEVFIEQNKAKLHLKGFVDELGYVIENIKGNSNYGEDMVEKVESLF